MCGTPARECADIILVSSITMKLEDREGSDYWLSIADKVIDTYPYPNYDQNVAVYNHLYQQSVDQRLLDTGIKVLTSLEAYITKARGANHQDLR